MEVILLENVRNLGRLGDKIVVKAGYGRNYLIPQKKAVFATENNVLMFESRRVELENKAQQLLAEAEQRAAKLNDITVLLHAMATDEGKLYGSVGANEIVNALKTRGFDVHKREIILTKGPLYSIGDYTVEVHVHNEIIAYLKIEVHPLK